MSTEIDKRVVEMQFNNKDFEKNVQTSLNTIDKLKMALNFDGAKGLDSITKAADKMDMSNVVKQTEKVKVSLSSLEVVGATVVSRLTNSFLNLGKNLISGALGQAKSGGIARALKIEQATFKMQALIEKMDGFEGSTEKVNQALKEMDKAIDNAVTGTAYGYDSAASVASQLMASGLTDAEQMEKDLRAIAGAASMTGRSYDDMGRIFAAVAGQGKMMGDQLLQFSSSGVNAAATIGKYLHKTEAEVREMVSKGQIDFRTFADAMSEAYSDAAGRADDTFSGVMSNVRAQLSRIGQIFAKPYIKNMIPFLKEVKQSLRELNKAISPTGERFDYIFGRLTNWAAQMVKDIDFTRFETMVRGVENIFWGLASVLYTVHEAFEEVFSRKTLEELNNSAIAFENFTKAILPTRETLDGVKTIAKATFLALSVLVKAVVRLSDVVKPLMFAVIKITGAVVKLVRHLKPVVDGLTDVIKESKVFEAICLIITDIVLNLVDVLMGFVDAIDAVLGAFMKTEGIQEFGNDLIKIYKIISTTLTVIIVLFGAAIKKLLSYLEIDSVAKVWSKLVGVFKAIASAVGYLILGFGKLIGIILNASDIFTGISEVISTIVDSVKSLFKGGDVSEEVDNVTKSTSGLADVLKNMADRFKKALAELNVGRVILILFAFGILALIFSVNELINSFSRLVGAATNTVKSVTNIQNSISTMAKNVAKYSGPTQFLIAFSIALATFTASVKTLTNDIDPNKLRAITPTIGLFIGGIIAAAAAMAYANQYFNKSVGLSVIAANMLAVSGSMLLLTFAIKSMAGITEDLGNLVSVTVSVILMMTGLAGAVAILSTMAPKFEASMVSILAFSAGIYITVKSLKQLESMDISSMIHQTVLLGILMISLGTAIGLAGMAGSIYKKDEKTLFKRGGVGFTLLSFAVAMLVLLQVLKELCSMPVEELQAGLKNLRNIMMSFMPLITVIAIASKLSGSGGMLIRDIASLFTSLSIALIAMFAAVTLFAKLMNPEELDRGVEAVRMLMSTITFFLAGVMLLPLLISSLTQMKTGKMMNLGSSALKELSAILLAMSVLMISVALCTRMVKDSTEDDIMKIIAILGMLGLVTMGIESLIQRSVGAKAAPIIATMVLIATVVASIAFLAAAVMTGGIDIGTLMVLMTGFGVLLAGLGVLFWGIGNMNRAAQKVPGQPKQLPANYNPNKPQTSGLQSVAMILGAAAIAAACALLFSYLVTMDIPSMLVAFGGLALIIGAFTLFIDHAKKVDVGAIKQAQVVGLFILPAVLMLMSLVGAFAMITDVIQNNDTGSWAMALAILAGMLIIIGVVFKNLVESANLNILKSAGLNMKETLACFAVIGGIIGGLMIIVGLLMAMPVNPTGLAAKIALVVIVLGAFAGIMMLSKKIDVAGINAIGLAMLEMAGAFLLISAAIALVASTPTDPQAESKFMWLTAIFVIIAGAAILIGSFMKNVDWVALAAVSGAVLAMSVSLIAIAAAMAMISKIDQQADLDKVGTILISILGIFAVLTTIAAVVGATGVGTGIAITIAAVAGAMLAFGLTLLAVAKSVDICADALTKFAALSEESIDQIIRNIHKILQSLPDIAADLIQFGPYLSLIVSTWITNIALAIGSATGAILMSVNALIIGVCNGLIASLPTILNTLSTMIRECNNWMIENKDIWIDTGKAITIAIMGVVQGVVEGFFEYFDVKLDELWQSIKDAKAAMEDNEEVKRTGSERMRDSMVEYYKTLGKDPINGRSTAFIWLDELQKRIDSGVITYKDAQDAVMQAGLDSYKGYIQEMGRFNGEQIREGTDLRKQLELAATESGKKSLDELKKNIEAAKKMTSDGSITLAARNEYINGLNDLIDRGEISYRLALMSLYDEGGIGMNVAEDAALLHTASNFGQSTAENFADGIEKGNEEVQKAADETVGIVEDAAEKMETAASGGGGAMSGKAMYAINSNGLRNMSASQLQILQNTFSNKANMETLGEGMAEDGGEAFVDQAEKENWITKLGNIFKPAADALGVDLGSILANGMTEGISSSDIIGMIGAAFTGEEYKTEGMWREYYNEMVPIVKEIGGYSKTVGYQSRYLAEGFESIDQALAENKKTGRDYFDWMHGGSGALSEINEAMNNALPNMNGLASSLGDVGDVSVSTAEKVDKLKESIESALDIFTEFNKEVNLTGREVLANFYSQLDGITSWQKELEALATRGMNKNFLNQLAEEGPKAYDRIHAFYTMTESEMTLFNTMYAQKLIIQRNTANDIRKSFVSTGNMLEKEVDKFSKSTSEKYGEQLAEAQAKAAASKSGEIKESTMKSLEEMKEEMEKEATDTEFIEQWKDYIGSSTVKLDLMNAFTQLGTSSVDAFAQSLKFQKVLEKILEFKNTVKEQVKSSLNLFDEVQEVEEKDKITTTEILNNMEENLKRVGGWSYNLKKMISMGFSEGLIEELRQMGPEAADKVEAFVKMTADEVSMANKYWGESVQLPEAISDRLTDEYAKAGFEISLGLKKGLDEGSEDFYDRFKVAGEDASKGYVDGIDPEAANDAMDQLGQNTLDRLMKKLDEHSPSREMMKIGANAVAGYLIGLKNGIKGIGTFTKELGDKVMNGFAENFSIADAMGNMGSGIDDILNTMTDELYNVGNAANMIDLDDVYEPVIRPVWDTTAIETGFTTIDQFLSGKVISLKAVDAAAQRSGPSQDAVMITNAINNLYNEQKIIRNDINGIRSDVSSLGNRIDGMRVVLDGNALVGNLVAPMDKAMGKKVISQKRGRL